MSSHANVGLAWITASRWVAQDKLNFLQDKGDSYFRVASGAFHIPPLSNLSLSVESREVA